MTYIIGDVHGEFDSLRQLVDKLPTNSDLIFVGDLIDRGRKSKEVVNFVRRNNHKCVHGNHEEMMCDYGKAFEESYPNLPSMIYYNNWMRNGGKETLLSYGLVEIDKHDGKLNCTENDEKFKEFIDDVNWMRTLPLYIKLENIQKNNKPIVISHSPITNEWKSKNNHMYNYDKNGNKTFSSFALYNRINPKDDSEIFNIFGHTIVLGIDTTKHFINVDTGCCFINLGYGKLSAYCIETGDVLSDNISIW
jgi:serine/threonine protein phosphatase 1